MQGGFLLQYCLESFLIWEVFKQNISVSSRVGVWSELVGVKVNVYFEPFPY